MARNHTLGRGEELSPKELLLKCSQVLDLGAELYLKIVRIREDAVVIKPEALIELDYTVMEFGGVLVHIASLIADKDNIESVREELEKRNIGNII